MKTPPAFQFYADDFVGGTCDLSTEEVGAYIRLLCYQWSRGCIPSDDEVKLARIAGVTVSTDVLAKFPSGVNARLEEERRKQDEYRAKQAAKGRASALARSNYGSTTAQPRLNHGLTAAPTAAPTESQPEVNSPSPISNAALDKSNAVGRAAKRSPQQQDDAAWISSLKADPAYAGMDVDREHARMVRYCEVNSKIPSRKRFINWLNRAERPIKLRGKALDSGNLTLGLTGSQIGDL